MNPEVVIDVQHLTVEYEGATRPALDDVSLQVTRGEVLGVIGPTAAGKTTLLKCLAGIIPHYERDVAVTGSIQVLGRDVAAQTDLMASSSDLGVVLQDPEVQLVNTFVREELAWGMENHGVPVEEIAERIEQAASLFGVSTLLDRFTHELSGGEKQRVVVAAAYCMKPLIMLLDEPSSELDPAGTESMMEAISVLTHSGITVVVIEHKVEELAQFADRVLVLDQGRVHSLGPVREVLTRPDALYRPQVLDVAIGLQTDHAWTLERMPLTVDEAVADWGNKHADVVQPVRG